MEQASYEAKIKEVLSDEAYLKELLGLETAEEVQASLKGKGIEMSVEEINQLHDLLVSSESEELSDEVLEQVGGGCGPLAVAFGILIGLDVAAGVGGLVAVCCMSRW